MENEQFLFHPMVVHFPIAFYCLELVLLLWWRFKKDESYLKFAFFTFRLGYLMMIVALITGYLMAGGITPMVQKHFYGAMSVLVIYTVRGIIWHGMKKRGKECPWTLILSSVIGIVAVAITADLGADMVYRIH